MKNLVKALDLTVVRRDADVKYNIYRIHLLSGLYLDNTMFEFKSILDMDVLVNNIEKASKEIFTATMEDKNGNVLHISNSDKPGCVIVKVNDEHHTENDVRELIGAINTASKFMSLNNKKIDDLLELKTFSIIEQGSAQTDDEEGFEQEITSSDELELCGYYSMILIGDTTMGGNWFIDNDGTVTQLGNTCEDLQDIRSRWIPLPIVLEMLGIELDFTKRNNEQQYYKTKEVIQMISDRIM